MQLACQWLEESVAVTHVAAFHCSVAITDDAITVLSQQVILPDTYCDSLALSFSPSTAASEWTPPLPPLMRHSEAQLKDRYAQACSNSFFSNGVKFWGMQSHAYRVFTADSPRKLRSLLFSARAADGASAKVLADPNYAIDESPKPTCPNK